MTHRECEVVEIGARPENLRGRPIERVEDAARQYTRWFVGSVEIGAMSYRDQIVAGPYVRVVIDWTTSGRRCDP